MQNIWLDSSDIGTFSYVEVLDYMDGPKLFSCVSASQQLYLVLWFGRVESGERFLAVQMSKDRYKMIRSGGLPLSLAFRTPESGTVLVIVKSPSVSSVTPTLAGAIDRSLLPDDDDYIELPTETLSVRIKDLALAQKAVSTGRETLELHLDSPQWYREEAPMKGLGRLLASTQELIDAIGQRIAGSPTLRGAISPEILTATEARVIQAGGGSFALEIAASQFADLYGESLVGRALRRLNDLLEIGGDAEPLREALLDIKPRAVSKYREFLSVVVENELDVATAYASPNVDNNTSARLTYSHAAAALLITEQVTKESTRPIVGSGVFDAVDIPRKTFAVVMNQLTYRGRILESALADAKNVTIGAPYYFRLLESLEIASSGEERLKYELDTISDRPVAAAVAG